MAHFVNAHAVEELQIQLP